MDNGFIVLKFTNGVYPLPPLAAPPVPPRMSEVAEILATPDAEWSAKPEVSVAGPGTVGPLAPKAAIDHALPTSTPPGRATVSAGRLQLAYVCVIVPRLDDRSVEQIIRAAPSKFR